MKERIEHICSLLMRGIVLSPKKRDGRLIVIRKSGDFSNRERGTGAGFRLHLRTTIANNRKNNFYFLMGTFSSMPKTSTVVKS